ncbi:MAG: EscU/YscU/HrcU family type III secretion system export apparatus switch protein [Pseudomonadota bacterium]
MSETAAPPKIAVALRYADDDAAPIVVASGRGSLAERIVAAAEEAGVSIDENPLLASALENVPVDEPIPEELYQAVAEVISWILRTKRYASGLKLE